MGKKELTAADVWAMFAETDRQMKENERKLNEKFEALGIKVKDINSNAVGIGNSNGEFAEEYFHESFQFQVFVPRLRETQNLFGLGRIFF